MSEVKFTVQGVPVAKQRPRVTRNATYTPAKTSNYEKLVRDIYSLTVGEYLGESALYVEIDFYFPVPKSYSKKRKQAIIEGEELYTKKPDLDNLAKTITDALNGVAYRDDSQIIEMKLKKHYSNNPRVEVGFDVVRLWENRKKEAWRCD